MGEVKQISIKKLIIFTTTWLILKISIQTCSKFTKSITKTLVFITLDISQSKKIDDYKSIYSVNPLYLQVNHANEYILEKNGKKYLIFDSTDENKEVLKKYNEGWDGTKNKIKAINDNKENDYGKNYIKIKFNSDDDLSLNKPLNFHAMIILVRSVFEEDGKLYTQVF